MAQTADFELLLDVEIESLQRALLRYAEATGRSLGVVVRQNTRLIAWNLAHNTQPYGMDLAAKKLGEAAVARDVGKVFASGPQIYKIIKFEATAKEARRFNKLVKNSNSAETMAGAFWQMLKGGRYGELRRFLKSLDIPEIDLPIGEIDPKIHKARWNSRGRVRGNAPSLIVPNAKDIRDYIKVVKKRVGYAKAGWITAGSRVGSITRVPAWITRHRGAAPGTADDRSHDKTNPHITLTNRVPYISRILPDHEVADALRIQREKMLAHIEHVLTEEARAAGFTAQSTGPAAPLPMAA